MELGGSEGAKDSKVSSSAASLDNLEAAEEQPPSPVAVPELLKHPASGKTTPPDTNTASDHKEKIISSAEDLGKDSPVVSIPLESPQDPPPNATELDSSVLPPAAPAPPRRSISLEVETGSATTGDQVPPHMPGTVAGGSPKDSEGKAEAATLEAGLLGTKSLDSDVGTLVVHSTASDSPRAVEADADSQLQPSTTLDSQVSGVSSANAYFTARRDLEKSDLGLGTPAGSRNLEESFEGISVEPKTVGSEGKQGKQSMPAGEQRRTGVTASPPRSPKSPPPRSPKAAASSKEGLSAESSGAFRQDSNTVAEELQEAEAKAEAEALAASQRASSMRDLPGKKGAAEEGEDPREAAHFTEENLQSAEPSRPAANGLNKARPMSPPPHAAAARPLQVSAAEVQSYEPPEYAGLVFHDGIDALGRPVVVVNADALAPKSSRKDAIAYMQQRLEPIIVQGPYVIVFLNSAGGSKSIPPGWLASCYRQLSYPFRKNVKHVILVRPSAGLKFMLAIMRPLLSPKAYVKVKKVANLAAMAGATDSEVTMQHLGPRFAAAMGHEKLVEMGSVRTGSA